MKQQKAKVDQKIQTANDFIDVKEIKRNLLYTKSGYVIGYLKLLPINISLLNNKELRALNINITSKIKAEKDRFSFFVVPRSVDMDKYLNFLEEKIESEMTSINKRTLLNAMVRAATQKVSSGQNFEHQFYLAIREKEGKEAKLNERIREFENYYTAVGNQVDRVGDSEILKLCNLFTNGIATLEEENNLYYTELPSIKS